MLDPNIAKLNMRVSNDGVHRKITVTPTSSTDAVRAVQYLTDNEGDLCRPLDMRGTLAKYTWHSPTIVGRDHTLEVHGERPDGYTVTLIIHKMSAGYLGSGSLDAVAILVHLGLGTLDYLTRVVTSTPPGYADDARDGWTVTLTPEELTPHGPQA